MHDPDTGFSLVLRKRAKAKAQEASQIGSAVLWAGIGLILVAFMVLQSF